MEGMQLVLSTARRKVASQWVVCLSCRGIIRHASTSSAASPPPKKYTSPSRASLDLRKSGPARTRFAPSPTGYLHLGSLRTALFNYLVAKATGGQFLLRIEDTDQKRTVHDAEERLFRDLEWAGIEWDEGPKVGGPYGPYKQSQRTAIYREHAEQLLQSGNAYRCFCTPERLRTLAEYRSKLGLPPDYDRTCAHIPKEESNDRAAHGEAHVVRLLVPDEVPAFNDLVYGLMKQRKGLSKFPRAALGPDKGYEGSFDDPILLKSDGFPTYHLANVVDDHLMKITHVIRGSEWMSSTPKHVAMYQAFGWTPPNFAHVGLLLDKDRQKLSKRLESMSIADLRDKGVFPETLTNFVALLGWSHNGKNDAMSLEDLISNASLKFTRGDTVVDFGKLWFLQKRHAARYASSPPSSNPFHDLNELALKPIINLLDQSGISHPERFAFYHEIPKIAREYYVKDILWADAKSYTNPAEFIERNKHYWAAPTPKVLAKSMPGLKLHNVPALAAQPTPAALPQFLSEFSEIPERDWSSEEIKSCLHSITQQVSFRSFAELRDKNKHWNEVDTNSAQQQWSKAWNKLVHQYLRWALMCAMPGPDCAEIMQILGREETLKRLATASELISSRAEEEKGVKARDDSVSDAVMMGAVLGGSGFHSGAVSAGTDIDGDAEEREVENAGFWEAEGEWAKNQTPQDEHEDEDDKDNDSDRGGGDGGDGNSGGDVGGGTGGGGFDLDDFF